MMIRILKNSHGHPFFKVKRKLGHNTNTKNCIGKQKLTSSKVLDEPIPHSAQSSVQQANHLSCKACSLAKTGSRPSYAKDTKQNIQFLQRIQGDICGPIQPECGPFKYFMVLVDASTRWSHVVLLSTRNAAFAKLLA